MEGNRYYIAKVRFFEDYGYTEEEVKPTLMVERFDGGNKMEIAGPVSMRYAGHEVIKYTEITNLIEEVMR